MSTIPNPSEPIREALAAYAALLRAWAPRIDLISPSDLERLEERHLEDSLKALPLVAGAPAGPCIDVGSGAGLPGVPLAIATDRFWRLVEPRRKRAAFLEEAVRELNLAAEVVPRRASDLARDPALAERHAVATARALSSPEKAVAACKPLVADGGRMLLWVGKRAKLPRDAAVSVEGLASIDVIRT